MTKCTRKRRSIAIAFLVTLAGLLGAASCSSPTESEGTNTNWVTCEKDDDCGSLGASFHCAGGVCRSSASSSLVVACNDGTGAADCCPDGVASGGECSPADAECWTQCTQGYRGHFVCSDGQWLAGHGLFPCGEDAGVRTDGGGLPACTWPASLDPGDTSVNGCFAARMYLNCSGAGGTEMCVSNDPKQCDSATPSPSRVCENQCAPNEFGAVCNGSGAPGPIPNPTAGCRSMGVTPGGTTFYCCPCQ